MNELLQQLEAFSRFASLKVSPEQRPVIAGKIVGDVLRPYFYQMAQGDQGDRDPHQAHFQSVTDYCLHSYIQSPEPQLTLDFIKGLHRQLYSGAGSVPLTTDDGSEVFMEPGEFKTLPNAVSRLRPTTPLLFTTAPEQVAHEMALLLEQLHDDQAPLFRRYFRFMLDLTSIHPFPDGNGRLALLLGDLFLLKRGMSPLYFARYKAENTQAFYELSERYSQSSQRDSSIFYPLAVAEYEQQIVLAQKNHAADKPTEWPHYQAVIKSTLSPKLSSKFKKEYQTNRLLVQSFEHHTATLAKFCTDHFLHHEFLTIQFIVDLHRMLYPPGFFIRSNRYGEPVDTKPGEWRRQEFLPDGPGYITASSTSDIAADFEALLNQYCAATRSMQNGRERSLAFYCDFIQIHPFADSNGTIAALLCNIECARHQLKPLNMLHLRAKDRALLFHVVDLYCTNRTGETLKQALRTIDDFHDKFHFVTAPALSEDLSQDASIARLFRQLGLLRSIYDDTPSAFQTYTRRSGSKRCVVEQVMTRLADHPLSEDIVVTDIGAGTGLVADGLLPALMQRKGGSLEYHFVEPSRASVDYFCVNHHDSDLGAVKFHIKSIEDFSLPGSDLILMAQVLQYIVNADDVLHRIISALKPGGQALIVVNHPDSDEWQMLKRLAPKGAAYEYLKGFLEKERIGYEEVLVESTVQISAADRDAPEGDDLLTFYCNTPASALPDATKEAFWSEVANSAKDGAVSKKEAFFWIRRPE